MDKKVVKAIRTDCHRVMWPCYVSNGLCRLMSLLIPTLAAWLVGDMTDALLALDVVAIRSRMLFFVVAIGLEMIAMPLFRMTDNLLIVRQAGRYEAFLMKRLLRRPLSAYLGETGATIAEHTIVHTPDYYFTQICKFTLPVTCIVNSMVLLAVLFTRALHPVFALFVFLFAAVPLLRSTIIGKQNAEIVADERDYQTSLAQEEETLFRARAFFRVNRLSENCLQNFQKHFSDWYLRSGQIKTNIQATRDIFTYLCSYGNALGVIFVGAILVLTGKMSVGALMTGYLLLPILTSFYRTISNQWEEIQQEHDTQSRLAVFYGKTEVDLADVEDVLPKDCPAAERICLNHVTFTYPGGEHPVLTDWSGSFAATEKIRITGENGSGKTTLVRLLAGLYAPQSGTITNEKGVILSKEELRRLVTIQEQDGFIFQGTVWDNLFSSDDKHEDAQTIMTALGFNKPMDYLVTAGASNLSPGEQQKILVTRALLRDSKFLIADEPLNHMDAAGSNVLISILQQRESNLILISHQGCSLEVEGVVINV